MFPKKSAQQGWHSCDSKAYEGNMGPIWGWQDPGGPHVGPMNFAIWVIFVCQQKKSRDYVYGKW